jgi:tetratricopeptide (TPR) repeat protein
VLVAALLAAGVLYELSLWMASPIEARRGTVPPTISALPTPNTQLDYVALGDELYRQGNVEDALARYRQAVDNNTADARIFARMAQLLIWRGRASEAVDLLGRAIDAEPDEVSHYALQCMAYDWSQSYDRAIETCLRAVDLSPTYAPAYAYLAEAYADAGQPQEGLTMANKALELDGKAPEVLRAHAYALQMNGDLSGAEKEYRQAVEAAPNTAFYRLALARFYRVTKQVDLAISELQKASAVEPGNPQGYEEMGLILYGRQQYEGASEQFQRAVDAEPESKLANRYLAWSYYLQGKYKLALTYFEKSTKLEPRREESFSGLGWTLFNLQQYDESRAAFQRALQLDPQSNQAQDGMKALEKH